MDPLDPTYPVFVLAFCVFAKDTYAQEIVPALLNFKFRYFGHDQIVLHESDIRKSRPPFDILFQQPIREAFLEDLNRIVEESEFTIIASGIRKAEISQPSDSSDLNPYHIALKSCLERIYEFLKSRDDSTLRTNFIFEARGTREDRELELEFRRVRGGDNRHGLEYPFDLVFAKKQINSCGLQLADLVARPIGRKGMSPRQENRAFSILEKKLFQDDGGRCEGYGLVWHP